MKHLRLSLMLLILLMLFAIACSPEPRRRSRFKADNNDAGHLNDTDHVGPAACGNGIFEPGELCDPGIASGPGACPTSCDDGDACTQGRLEGSANNCTAHCVFDPITTCQGGDGCCPNGCSSGNDSDCVAGCGDGVLDPGESCDWGIESGPGFCPTACVHAEACLKGTMQGHPSTCTARCVYEEITLCQNGDGCCPAGCTAANDDDCVGCVPLTCAQAGVQCGATNNGCGESMNCPACPTGHSCVGGQCFAPSTGACTSVARVRVVGTQTFGDEIWTQPLENVELQGDIANGTIGRYEWSIITRPASSSQQLTPNNAAQNPQLWLDLAGTYEFELVAYDANGLACQPAQVTVHAVPEAEIHIQLTWTIPNVPNPTTELGTDLDLHYLHPTGAWNYAPGDIHWKNREQNWGTEANPSMATLDIDDLRGLGPENINHVNPRSGLNYAIGVHYFADYGHGASIATVRVYIDGDLRRQLDKRLEAKDDFWYVGFFPWPSGSVTVVDTVGQGFP